VDQPRISGHNLRQLSGSGVLARYGDLTLLCDAVPEQEDRVGALIDTLTDAAAANADGRHLSRRLAGLLSTDPEGEFPALCAFGPADGGFAVLVHGRAELTLSTNGKVLRLDGRDAVTVIDRVIGEPVEWVGAVLGDRLNEPSTDQWSRLDAGVVRADALIYEPGEDHEALAIGSLPDQDADLKYAAEPIRVPGGTEEENLETPVRVTTPSKCPEPDHSPDVPESPRPTAADEPAELSDMHVLGVHCKNEHFNDPNVAYCSVCGISMTQAPGMPVWGVRPQLGVLVLDDGTTYPLQRDCVVGRMPEMDNTVAAGQANPVPLSHPSVSTLHARVELDDWQVKVIDVGSASGTFLLAEGQSSWTRLAPGARVTLAPGTVMAFGQRQMRYCSHRH
jgi:hypothetical protein